MKQQQSNSITGHSNLHSWCRVGVIFDCSPSAHTVDVSFGNDEYARGVPISGVYGASYDEDLVWVNSLVGAKALLIDVSGTYYMLTTLPNQMGTPDGFSPAATIGTSYGAGAENTYGKITGVDYSATRPGDYLPGDKIIRADGTTELTLFKGGLAKLKASALCQIILAKYQDLVRIVTRRFQLFSDFGEIETFSTSAGKVGLKISGGAAYSGESGGASPQWTVQCMFGHSDEDGDSRLAIKVKSPGGGDYINLKLGASGSAAMEMSKDMALTVMNNSTEVVMNDKALTVLGNANIIVNGKLYVQADGGAEIHSPEVSIN